MDFAVSHAQMRSDVSPIRSFVIRHAVAGLLGSAAAVTILAAAAMALVEFESPRPNWQAYETATLIAVVVAILSSMPVAACVNRPLMVALGGYFVSAAVRIVGVIAGIVVAVYFRHVAMMPVVIMVMIYYAALLVVESLVMGLALWHRSK
jgi:hypothetical protein